MIPSFILFYIVPFVKVGVGMSMEGIEQNPVVYDLMSEMAFRQKKVNVKVISSFPLPPPFHICTFMSLTCNIKFFVCFLNST